MIPQEQNPVMDYIEYLYVTGQLDEKEEDTEDKEQDDNRNW